MNYVANPHPNLYQNINVTQANFATDALWPQQKNTPLKAYAHGCSTAQYNFQIVQSVKQNQSISKGPITIFFSMECKTAQCFKILHERPFAMTRKKVYMLWLADHRQKFTILLNYYFFIPHIVKCQFNLCINILCFDKLSWQYILINAAGF